MRHLLAVAGIILGGGLLLARAQTDTTPGQADTRAFMRLKLAHSQQILEGITLENYNQIAEQAEQLKLLSFDADWQVLHTPEYTRQSADFRRAADLLGSSAKDQNLDAGVLAYFRLTQTCVDCHRHVRSQQR
jgi:hypothetical protein